MRDRHEREIDYLRVSVTDRCDLRCVYCMPESGIELLSHDEVLRYEEILRLAGIFASLGVKKIRLTGGEPLVRAGLETLVGGLRAIDGIRTVMMTTNGMLLEEKLPALARAGLDGVNVSLDTLDEELFFRITRRPGAKKVIRGIDAALAIPGFRVKLNCVPTEQNRDEIPALVRFAGARGVPIRFIELMPIGEGQGMPGLSEDQVREVLTEHFGEATPIKQADPREKCRYVSLPGGETVGFISALSHKFCASCDRIRLTADGFLKTCLQYDTGVRLKPLLQQSDRKIRDAIVAAVREKPAGHHFGRAPEEQDEKKKMSQIGG